MKLAIKGHSTQGSEVIARLEMLGGINAFNLNGSETNYYYYIDVNNKIYRCLGINPQNYIVYTLEEFLEKFPYKVGDKVWLYYENSTIRTEETINSMRWCSKYGCVLYDVCTYCNLKEYAFTPYKEETMNRKYNVEEYLKVWEETEKGLEVVVNDNFELKEDNGKFYIIKKQPQYPKTYEECCNVLGYSGNYNMILTTDIDCKLFNALYRLKVCRDAYWKIAGDWKYDVNKTEDYFYIVNKCGRIVKEHYMNFNHILAFPTEEMRDAFYENFKELIENCKELL